MALVIWPSPALVRARSAFLLFLSCSSVSSVSFRCPYLDCSSNIKVASKAQISQPGSLYLFVDPAPVPCEDFWPHVFLSRLICSYFGRKRCSRVILKPICSIGAWSRPLCAMAVSSSLPSRRILIPILMPPYPDAYPDTSPGIHTSHYAP